MGMRDQNTAKYEQTDKDRQEKKDHLVLVKFRVTHHMTQDTATKDNVHRLISTLSTLQAKTCGIKWVCFIGVSCCSMSRCAESTVLLRYTFSSLLQSPFSWRWHTSDNTHLASRFQPDSPLTLFSSLFALIFSHFRLFEVVWCQGPESCQVIEEKTFFVPAIAHVALLNNSTWKSNKPDPLPSPDLKMLLSNSTLATVSHIFTRVFFPKILVVHAVD